jgi:hypothetical protein
MDFGMNTTAASLLHGGVKYLPRQYAETLLIETNSLFSVKANLTLPLWKGSGILASVPVGSQYRSSAESLIFSPTQS